MKEISTFQAYQWIKEKEVECIINIIIVSAFLIYTIRVYNVNKVTKGEREKG